MQKRKETKVYEDGRKQKDIQKDRQGRMKGRNGNYRMFKRQESKDKGIERQKRKDAYLKKKRIEVQKDRKGRITGKKGKNTN